MDTRIERSDSLQSTQLFVGSLSKLKNLATVKSIAKETFLSNKFLLISISYLNLTLADTARSNLAPRGIISEKVASAWKTSALIIMGTIFLGEYLCGTSCSGVAIDPGKSERTLQKKPVITI